jgi:hypothetical protein
VPCQGSPSTHVTGHFRWDRLKRPARAGDAAAMGTGSGFGTSVR